MLFFTILVSIKTFVPMKSRMTCLTTNLTRDLVVVVVAASSSITTMKSAIATTAHRSMTTPSTVIHGVHTYLLMFPLRLNSGPQQ
jgi:hypothetical protein